MYDGEDSHATYIMLFIGVLIDVFPMLCVFLVSRHIALGTNPDSPIAMLPDAVEDDGNDTALLIFRLHGDGDAHDTCGGDGMLRRAQSNTHVLVSPVSLASDSPVLCE